MKTAQRIVVFVMLALLCSGYAYFDPNEQSRSETEESFGGFTPDRSNPPYDPTTMSNQD